MPQKNRPYGDCHEAAVNSAMELQAIKTLIESGEAINDELRQIYDVLNLSNDIKVVQGTVVPPMGPDLGRTIDHTWIEVGDISIETSNGQKIPCTTAEFNKAYRAYPVKKYSPIEANELATTLGYGPWHKAPNL